MFSSRKVEIFTQLITRPITPVKSYTTFSNVFASTLLECNRSYTRGMHSKNEASISFFEMFNSKQNSLFLMIHARYHKSVFERKKLYVFSTQ